MTAWYLDIWMSRTAVTHEDRDGRLEIRGSLHTTRREVLRLCQFLSLSPSPSACTYNPSSRSEASLFPRLFLPAQILPHAT